MISLMWQNINEETMGTEPKILSGKEIADLASQMNTLVGMNTKDIMTTLFRGSYETQDIPKTTTVLRQCIEIQNSFSRNDFVDSLLEPLTPLTDTAPRIESSLVALEKLKKPNHSLHVKDYGALKDSLKKLGDKRDTSMQDYKKFLHERDLVIQNIIKRLNDGQHHSPPIDLTKDQVIQNEIDRIYKMRSELLYKLEQLNKEKSTVSNMLFNLHNTILESLPPEQRPSAPIPTNLNVPLPRVG